MKSTIHFLALAHPSSSHGFISGTCDRVTRGLHEEWELCLAKDFQILISGFISNKNGKQNCSRASSGDLIINNKTMEPLVVIDCFSSMGLDLKHFKATQLQEIRWLIFGESGSLQHTDLSTQNGVRKSHYSQKNAALARNVQF